MGSRRLYPIIVILHYHELVTRTEFLFAPQYLVANALIEDIGTLVTACHHHRLVETYLRIAGRQCLDKLVAWHDLDVSKALKVNLRQFTSAIIHQPSDLSSIVQDA